MPQVDGIMLPGQRLWAVQNTNQVSRIRLRRNLASGVVEKSLPATCSRCHHRGALGSRLVVVNAKFNTGVAPTATQDEVVVVKG